MKTGLNIVIIMCTWLSRVNPTLDIYYLYQMIRLDVLYSFVDCKYKAWQLDKVSESLSAVRLPGKPVTTKERLVAAAYLLSNGGEIRKQASLKRKAEAILVELEEICKNEKPPKFYRIKHCQVCKFQVSCNAALKERDCISLLSGMPAKTIERYHSKGIFTVLQLSHLFRVRRRVPKSSNSYLWELKALAIRDKKTFVLKNPELNPAPTEIYLDFEGLPDDKFEYLLGVLIKKLNQPDEYFQFWANSKADMDQIFINLLTLLERFPDAPVYHYGSYELTVLKNASKRIGNKEQITSLEKRMINLLGVFRNNVYPPTYSNGLKDIGNFLGFEWTDKHATGLLSIDWRKQWEGTRDHIWKHKLLNYNLDDCKALATVTDWLYKLSNNETKADDVMELSKMKRQSPYKLQHNVEFGEDFQYINKAAYFDYQRTRIYWRNEKMRVVTKKSVVHHGKGKPVWKPKRINEVIVLPRLKKCPHCGHDKLYLRAKGKTWLQTDIKFTPTGIKQWILQYYSSGGKCARCLKKYNDNILRRVQVGDNLLAWAVNLYVNYHVSFAMISRMLQEQFGIWTNPTYFNDRIYQWWDRFKPDVEYCKKIIFNCPVIHIDETTVRLTRGNDKGYVWVFATGHTIYYHLTITREAGFLHEWFKDYKGVIVTDFYPGYDSLPVKQQKCLVHLIRDMNDDLFKNPFDEDYKILVAEFGQLLKKIIVTIDRYGLKKRHLQKHLKDIASFYKRFVEADHKSDQSTKCAKRLKKSWNELWTFLSHDGLPWNNNNAEVAIKAFAQHRRGVNGQMSQNGLRPYLCSLTIAQTWRYREVSFLDFLRGKTGIWKNIHPDLLPDYLPFNQARLYVRSLKFKRIKDLKEWENSGKRPAFIPDNPTWFYKDEGWKDWWDWIGV